MATVLHSSLTGSNLHEPKGVAAASSGQVYVANGAGSGAWTTPNEPVFMNKHIAGLGYQNAGGDPTNDITILAGTARDSTNTEDMTLPSSITKRLDAAWTVGSNQGGLDTGSIANTTYHIWLIKRTDTDVVDALFSTSATAPTMPTNYTKKRRIGSFVRVAAAIQTVSVEEIMGGGIEVLITPVESGTLTFAATGTNNTLTNFPSGVKFEAYVSYFKSGASDRVVIASPDQTIPSLAVTLAATSFNPTASYNPGTGDGSLAYELAGFARARTNTSAQVKCASASGGGSFTVTTYGWKDSRRD